MVKPKTPSRGFTLLSIMVGLLLSLIVVLAMLGLYRGVVRNVFGKDGVVRNAKQDGALASGLLTAQIAIQEAGFGIPRAGVGTEFVALTGAKLDRQAGTLAGTALAIGSAEAAADVLLWESNPQLAAGSDAWRCQALWSGRTAEGQPFLHLLRTSEQCHPIAARFAAIKWTEAVLVPPGVIPQPVGLTAQAAANCWPFGSVPKSTSGVAPDVGALRVRLSYRNSSTGTATEAADRSFVVCLPNYKP